MAPSKCSETPYLLPTTYVSSVHPLDHNYKRSFFTLPGVVHFIHSWTQYRSSIKQYAYLGLCDKVCTIVAVSQFELGYPLVRVLSALDSNGSCFDDTLKSDLNPLICVVCSCRPGARCTSASGSVEPGVRRSMVAVPLAIEETKQSASKMG